MALSLCAPFYRLDSGWLSYLISEGQWTLCLSEIPKTSKRHVKYQDGLTKETPLHDACKLNAPVDIVRLLIEKGADVDATDFSWDTPLHHACAHQASLGTVLLLLEHGANVNAADEEKATPLILACETPAASVEIVGALLEQNYGADVNAFNAKRKTALHFACENRAPFELIRTLLARGANVHAKDYNARTPFEYEDRPEALALLTSTSHDWTFERSSS